MGLFDFFKTTAVDYFKIGCYKQNNKDYRGAIEEYSKAIQLNPKYTNAYYNRGITYSYLEDNYYAINDLNMVIKLDPNISNAYKKRGYLKYENDDYEGAFEDLNELIKIEANNEEVLLLIEKLKTILISGIQENCYLLELRKNSKNFSIADEITNKVPTAEEIAKTLDMTIYEIRPNHRSRSEIIAYAVEKNIEAHIYYEKGLYRDGIKSAKEAVSYDEKNVEYLDTLSLGYTYIQDHDKALITSNKAMKHILSFPF